jgi:CRISPR-associated protein Cas2
MYAIIVYDIKVERVNKVKGYLRKHLNWIQNSVFEGDITLSELEIIKKGLKDIINKNEDSVIIFTVKVRKHLKDRYWGLKKHL